MVEEPDNLVLELLRTMRGENSARFDELETIVKDVRLNVASLESRFDALDERVEIIREGTVSAIGYAAHASREHANLRKKINELEHRVERIDDLERRIDDLEARR